MTVTGETVTVVLSGELDVTTEDFLTSRLARVRQARPRRLIFEYSAGHVHRLRVGTAYRRH